MQGKPVWGPRGRCGRRQNAGMGPVDWFATLSQARERPKVMQDLRYRSLQSGSGQLWLILLDSSGSTLKDHGLAAAKGALASLLELAYIHRTRIGMLQFAGREARLSIPPQRAPRQHGELINRIAGGGGTPLRQALEEAVRVLARERKRFPDQQQTLVLFTDGRSRDAVDAIQPPCRTLVIDTETGPVRLGRCRQLANQLNGEYLNLDTLPVRLQQG